MAKISKRFKAIREKLQPGKAYPLDEAFALLKDLPKAKFAESIDVAVNLGGEPRKSAQGGGGFTALPHGNRKRGGGAGFTPGGNVEAATAAGADIVGMDDLAAEVKAGKMDFDVVIASPDAMRVVGQLGQILGPRGLMPNPKVGTVTPNVAEAVKNAKAGQVQYRADKAGIVQCTLGRASFAPEALCEHLKALVEALNKAKPAASKGIYLQRLSVSSTMGPGIHVDIASVNS